LIGVVSDPVVAFAAVVIVAAVNAPPTAVAANMSRLENIVVHSSLREKFARSKDSRELFVVPLT
jgi:hypothetical protein